LNTPDYFGHSHFPLADVAVKRDPTSFMRQTGSTLLIAASQKQPTGMSMDTTAAARYSVQQSPASRDRVLGYISALTILVCAALLSACQSNRPVAMPANDEWRHLSFEQRHAQMTFAIQPTLARRYQAFYRTDAPTLTCRSCHGEDAERVRYQIAYTPIEDLKPSQVRLLYLPDADLSDEQRFKRDVITPLMADLLDVPAYDPATGAGFSCFGCHPRERE